jgi:hypothetical protein
MSLTSSVTALAPFRVRSFRFQWPADLATSWAFEMETIILGWYVLVETGSVLWLTAFGALTFLGTMVPFVLAGTAAAYDSKPLAIAAAATGLVTPSLGHLLCRRKITRGLVVRVVGAAALGLSLLAARGAKNLDAAFGTMAVCLLICFVAFGVGCVLDIVDTQDASAARSRNV